MAPGAYVKHRRYEGVRRQMLESSAGLRNVTEAALEFGFSHLGRFAAEYRGLFGELPSETLARRRRRSAAPGRFNTPPC